MAADTSDPDMKAKLIQIAESYEEIEARLRRMSHRDHPVISGGALRG